VKVKVMEDGRRQTVSVSGHVIAIKLCFSSDSCVEMHMLHHPRAEFRNVEVQVRQV
jgi:hypothetical protein